MIKFAYAFYGDFVWMAVIAMITYWVMGYTKKSFLPLTENIKDCKTRVGVNMGLGIGMALATAIIVGRFGCMLFGVTVNFGIFVAAGFIANYMHELVSAVKNAAYNILAKTIASYIKTSNKDLSDEDVPEICAYMEQNLKSYKKSDKNAHGSEVKTTALSVAESFGIEGAADEMKAAISECKSKGLDTAEIEKLFEAANADGRITKAEKDAFDKLIEACR